MNDQNKKVNISFADFKKQLKEELDEILEKLRSDLVNFWQNKPEYLESVRRGIGNLLKMSIVLRTEGIISFEIFAQIGKKIGEFFNDHDEEIIKDISSLARPSLE